MVPQQVLYAKGPSKEIGFDLSYYLLKITLFTNLLMIITSSTLN